MASITKKRKTGAKKSNKKSEENKISFFRPSLFWDVEKKNLDTKKHAPYIIERILDFGNDEEVRWMWKSYPQVVIKKVVKNSRVLHPSSRSLWTLLTKKKKK